MINKAINLKLVLFIFIGAISLPTYSDTTDDWTVHGFAAQGAIKAADSNFVNHNGESSLELTEIGLNASYQWLPDLRIAGQAVYINGGNRYEEGIHLDYLFLDWTAASELDWQLNLYLGRYKNQHWLYSSTRDIPHTRPSIVLPQSVYYDILRDLTLGFDGVGLAYTTTRNAGEFDFFWSYGTTPVSKKENQLLLSEHAKGDLDADYIHQASGYFRPENSNWQFGLSLLDTNYEYSASAIESFFDFNGEIQRTILSMLYSGERWELAAELIQERIAAVGFISPDNQSDIKGQGYYVQGRYLFDQQLTFLLRYDRFDTNKDDRNGSKLEQSSGGFVPASFGYSYDTTFGVTYRINNNWQLQAEYHWIEGTGRLSPAAIPDVLSNNKKNRKLYALQLMYWF